MKIVEVTPPGNFWRLPIYHIEITTNGSHHDALHDSLWMQADAAVELDLEGHLVANSSMLQVADCFDLSAIPNESEANILRYSAMRDEYFKMANVISAFKDLTLKNDDLVTLTNLYRSIHTNLRVANKMNVNFPPPLIDLNPSNDLRTLILPPPSCSNFGRAMACYDSVADIIQQLLDNPDFTVTAPKARIVLSEYQNDSTDGIDMLNGLLVFFVL